jgi:hypothetical protein
MDGVLENFIAVIRETMSDVEILVRVYLQHVGRSFASSGRMRRSSITTIFAVTVVIQRLSVL